MIHIYPSAFDVVVWLEDSSYDSDSAMIFINAL